MEKQGIHLFPEGPLGTASKERLKGVCFNFIIFEIFLIFSLSA